MTSLLVDTVAFVDAAERARASAGKVAIAVSRAATGFQESGRMAGSDPHGVTWARSYDDAARQLIGYGAQLETGVSVLARKLAVTGYYYEVVEMMNAGGDVADLTLPAPILAASAPAIPSAAGGKRAVPSWAHDFEWVYTEIMNLIGDAWPDGDTAQLDEASRVWHRLADDLDDVSSSFRAVTDALGGMQTPELDRAHATVEHLRTFTVKLAKGCRELGAACNTLSGKIAYVHTQTEVTIGIAVAAILATAAVSLGLTPFTFGLSDALGAAGVAGETAGAAATITGFIAEFGATVSSAVGGVVASAAGMVGISADLAAIIGVTVGDVTATAVVWGYGGAVENTIVTAVTEPGSDLAQAADDGFINWGIGGALGGGLGKLLEVAGGGRVLTLEQQVQLGQELRQQLREADLIRRDPTTGNRPDGSWAATGLTLDPADNVLVQQYAADAVTAEARIRPGLQALIEGGSPDARLVGLDESVKYANSLKLKVAAMMDRDAALSASDALNTVKDSVRYTAEIPDGAYVDVVTKTVEGMKADGYILTKEPANSWAGPGYRGINSSWIDPATGRTFEVQFHTPESFATKTESHDLYVALKVPGISSAEATKLEAANNRLFEQVPIPPGAPDLRIPVGG